VGIADINENDNGYQKNKIEDTGVCGYCHQATMDGVDAPNPAEEIHRTAARRLKLSSPLDGSRT
jgi:hypothetical protein